MLLVALRQNAVADLVVATVADLAVMVSVVATAMETIIMMVAAIADIIDEQQ